MTTPRGHLPERRVKQQPGVDHRTPASARDRDRGSPHRPLRPPRSPGTSSRGSGGLRGDQRAMLYVAYGSNMCAPTDAERGYRPPDGAALPETPAARADASGWRTRPPPSTSGDPFSRLPSPSAAAKPCSGSRLTRGAACCPCPQLAATIPSAAHAAWGSLTAEVLTRAWRRRPRRRSCREANQGRSAYRHPTPLHSAGAGPDRCAAVERTTKPASSRTVSGYAADKR